MLKYGAGVDGGDGIGVGTVEIVPRGDEAGKTIAEEAPGPFGGSDSWIARKYANIYL